MTISTLKNEKMNENIALFLIAQLVSAVAASVGIYAAIRADMREFRVKITALEKLVDKHQERMETRKCPA